MPFESEKDVAERVKGTKKLSPRKRRQFLHVWNSCYEKNGDDPKCYAMAWGVVRKTACLDCMAKDVLKVARDVLGIDIVHAGKDNGVRPGTLAMTAKGTGVRRSRSAVDTFKKIQETMDPGDNHHLRLVCVLCGNVQTCRCSAPKKTVEGICFECAEARGIEW